MNADIKKRWVEALRSGEYKQGRGQLRQQAEGGDYYCCLGVLCDIAANEGVGAWRDNAFVARGVSDGFLPPRAVIRWAELVDPNPFLGDTGGTVAGRNDDGRTFAEIADLIEAQL